MEGKTNNWSLFSEMFVANEIKQAITKLKNDTLTQNFKS